ncbi:DNA-binding protein [Bacteroidia bacterium]|nr:DNA-binding protein [Bacteroidia bacterium]
MSDIVKIESANIQNKICEVRGQKVMLDFHIAEIYEVETRVLNQAVQRNIELFPSDFMFQLTKEEWQVQKSQNEVFEIKTENEANLKSQFVTSSWGGTRKLPFAFTEHGVTMLANVLKSKKARLTSVTIVRAFIALKQFALNYKEIADKLKQIETKYDTKFGDIEQVINYLLNKDKIEIEQKKRRRIGYEHVYE